MKLAGKVAIITGGSRGIGKATAKLFVQEGANVTITSKDPNRLQEAAKEVGNVFSVPGDIRNESDVQNVVKKTAERFGRIDILVNNAGIFPKVKPLHKISEKEWNEVIDVNLTGQFRFTKAVIPYLEKNGGCIINVSSNAGLKAFENFEVDAYTEPLKALDDFKPNVYDLSLFDIRMPKMNGFELCREIKKKEPNAKICFITAFEIYLDEFRRIFPTLDVQCFIRKPIGIKDLISHIKLELNIS